MLLDEVVVLVVPPVEELLVLVVEEVFVLEVVTVVDCVTLVPDDEDSTIIAVPDTELIPTLILRDPELELDSKIEPMDSSIKSSNNSKSLALFIAFLSPVARKILSIPNAVKRLSTTLTSPTVVNKDSWICSGTGVIVEGNATDSSASVGVVTTPPPLSPLLAASPADSETTTITGDIPAASGTICGTISVGCCSTT